LFGAKCPSSTSLLAKRSFSFLKWRNVKLSPLFCRWVSNIHKIDSYTWNKKKKKKGFFILTMGPYKPAGCHNRTFQPKLWWLKLSFYDTMEEQSHTGQPSRSWLSSTTYKVKRLIRKKIQSAMKMCVCVCRNIRPQMTFQKKISLPRLDTHERGKKGFFSG